MKLDINFIAIITNNFKDMLYFYHQVLDFKILKQQEEYVEFKNNSLCFALSSQKVMSEITQHKVFSNLMQSSSFQKPSFELAFKIKNEEELHKTYQILIHKGVVSIQEHKIMKWGQLTAFFQIQMEIFMNFILTQIKSNLKINGYLFSFLENLILNFKRKNNEKIFKETNSRS